MNKSFIKYDITGKIICVVNSNDKSLKIGDGKNIVDITNFKDKEKVKENPNYFKFNKNKLVELTNKQKVKINNENQLLG